MSQPVTSPLTGTSRVTLVQTIRTDHLIERWQAQFQCDISPDLAGIEQIQLYRCDETGLLFFWPARVAGGEGLYRQLEAFDWYYMPWKWEHSIALEDLRDCRRVLEVGCGRGDFLGRLQSLPGTHAEGLELNASAAKAARDQGRSVHTVDLKEFAQRMSEPYDAVCAFQVLEHVPNPGEFLKQLAEVTRPGGRIIVSVPNHTSLLHSTVEVLLDQPPHHMSQWTASVFERLAPQLSLDLRHVRYEPLAAYHVDYFLQCLAHRQVAGRRSRKWLRRLFKISLGPALRWLPATRNLVFGHTLYVCLERRAESASRGADQRAASRIAKMGPGIDSARSSPMGKFLNLGCGARFHPAWTNVDMAPLDPSVIRHNLLRPLPFESDTFDAVYHSHVLEHLSQEDAPGFLRECHRVLQPGGVVRIAVPNLESIARIYLEKLERAVRGDERATADRHWMVLELLDQTVRRRSGGDMAAYLRKPDLTNESFVLQRMGAEARAIMGRDTAESVMRPRRRRRWHEKVVYELRKALRLPRELLLKCLLGSEHQALQVGRFRLAGEVHQWMYDRLSLAQLLKDAGFIEPRQVSPYDSSIAHWNDFYLDTEEDGAVRKPDSLFMEAIKPRPGQQAAASRGRAA